MAAGGGQEEGYLDRRAVRRRSVVRRPRPARTLHRDLPLRPDPMPEPLSAPPHRPDAPHPSAGPHNYPATALAEAPLRSGRSVRAGIGPAAARSTGLGLEDPELTGPVAAWPIVPAAPISPTLVIVRHPAIWGISSTCRLKAVPEASPAIARRSFLRTDRAVMHPASRTVLAVIDPEVSAEWGVSAGWAASGVQEASVAPVASGAWVALVDLEGLVA